MDPEEEQRQRDEEARQAAQEAMAQIARIEVPRLPALGTQDEPPDEPREAADFEPTTRQRNRQRDQELFNPQANQRAAQAIGNQYRAGAALDDPREIWPGSQAPRTRDGSPSQGPFRVYPPGQMPPRTRATFPDQSAWSTSDLPDIDAPPSDQPARRREVTPPPQPAAQADADRARAEAAGIDFSAPGVDFSADDPLVQEQERAAVASTQQPPMARAPSAALGAPGEPAEEFVDPTKEEAPPPDRRAQIQALIDRRAKMGGAEPGPRRPDYTGVDTADAIRRVFHALGSGLRAAGGAAPLPFRSYGDEARQRDNQQMLLNMRAKQQARAQDIAGQQASSRTALDRDRLNAQIADLQARRGLESERNDISSRFQQERADISRARGDAAMQESRARIARIESVEAREREATDPNSEASRVAQGAVRLTLRGYPPAAQDRIESEYGSIDQLNQRSAEQVMRAMPSMFRDLTNRRPARGTGQGGRGAPAEPSAPPSGWNGSPEEWARLSSRQQQSVIARLGTQRPRAADEEENGVEIVPGVRASLDIGDVEARSVRGGIAEARGHFAALNTIDDVTRRYGARAVVDPRIEAELVAPTQAMMAMVATLRNTGVINPQEAPTIEAAIPNPTQLRQMTLGEVQTRIRSFQTLVEQRVRANLAAMGVDEAGQQRTIRFLRSGRFGGERGERGAQQQQRGAPTGDRVNIQGPPGPNGEPGEVRAVRREVWERNRAAQEQRGFHEVGNAG